MHGNVEHACCGRGSGSVVVVVHGSILLRAIVAVVDCPVLRAIHVVVDSACLLSWLRRGEAHQVGVACCCDIQHTTVSLQHHLCLESVWTNLEADALPTRKTFKAIFAGAEPHSGGACHSIG